MTMSIVRNASLATLFGAVVALSGCGAGAEVPQNEPETDSVTGALTTCSPGCTSTMKCVSGQCVPASDAVLMDPSVGSLSMQWTSASNPTLTSIPVVFTPVACGAGMCATRDVGTKTQPVQIPCDTDFLAVGVAWKNVSSQPLYIEWGGALWNMGDEKKPIPDAFGRSEVGIGDGRLFAPGEVGTGGFIFTIQPPYVSWPELPANVPLRIQMTSKGFTSPTIDPARGSYALANEVPEDIIWNNNFRIWVRRTCP